MSVIDSKHSRNGPASLETRNHNNNNNNNGNNNNNQYLNRLTCSEVKNYLLSFKDLYSYLPNPIFVLVTYYRFHGKGTLYFPDGSKYVGEWKKGKVVKVSNTYSKTAYKNPPILRTYRLKLLHPLYSKNPHIRTFQF